jgi:hypothetical protein
MPDLCTAIITKRITVPIATPPQPSAICCLHWGRVFEDAERLIAAWKERARPSTCRCVLTERRDAAVPNQAATGARSSR